MKKKNSQNLIIWLCWAIYTFAYLGRYSYNSNISLIIEDFSITRAEAGLVTTFFFFAYGIGQVVNGFLSKYYNKKYIFPIVLFISSILNLLVTKIPFTLFKYVWLINGFLQSCLWSSIISVLSNNIDSKNMNKAMLLMSLTTTVGTFCTYGASSFFAWLGNFRLSFVFGAIVMSIIGILWLFLFKPNPQPTAEQGPKESTKSGKLSGIGFLFILLAVFAIMDNFIKDGLNTWIPTILKEKYSMPDSLSILLTLVLPVLGAFGAIVALKLNKYISDFVALIAVFFASSAIFIAVITFNSDVSPAIMLLFFGIVTCMMHGVNNVITSIAPLKMRDKIDSGRLAGILNGFCYVGSTVSSYGLGAVADKGGWETVFYLIFVSCVVSIVLGALYIFILKLRNKNDIH